MSGQVINALITGLRTGDYTAAARLGVRVPSSIGAQPSLASALQANRSALRDYEDEFLSFLNDRSDDGNLTNLQVLTAAAEENPSLVSAMVGAVASGGDDFNWNTLSGGQVRAIQQTFKDLDFSTLRDVVYSQATLTQKGFIDSLSYLGDGALITLDGYRSDLLEADGDAIDGLLNVTLNATIQESRGR